MSIRRVVSNVGVFHTWVNVLTMSLRSPFKHRPFVLFFGMPCRECKLFFGLTIIIDATSDSSYLEMISGPLTVQLLLSCWWIHQLMSCLLFLVWICCSKGLVMLQPCWYKVIRISLTDCNR